MNMLRCFVIDDDSEAILLLKEYIEKTPFLVLAGTAENPLEALDALTGQDAPDITFMDIDMRQLSGLELAGMVNLYTSVVFTTAFPQFALQAFEKEAFDYLLKPINYERFIKCLQRIRRKMHRLAGHTVNHGSDFFDIKSEVKGRMVKLRFEEVHYIEGAANYILLYTAEGKHMTYLTMGEIQQHLPGRLFARIHRSFIVNIDSVRIIERNRIKLDNGIELPMGNHYKQRFLEIMDEKLINTDRAS